MLNLGKGRVLGCILTSVVLATGCSSGTNTGNVGNKTLIVDTTFAVSSMDPTLPGAGGGQTAHQLLLPVYETLVHQDAAHSPYLAQSYVASPDGLSVTFKLRHDVHFSDGTPMTSADVVFSIMRARYSTGGEAHTIDNLTATAPDPYTVLVTSSNPDVFITSQLSIDTVGIVNSKVVEANGGVDTPNEGTTDTAEAFLNQHSAGSGPYELVSADYKTQIEMKADPNYWGSKTAPVYTKIIFRNEASAAQLLDVQQGQDTMVLDLSPQQAASVDKSKVNVATAPSLEIFTLMLNVNRAVSTTTSNQMLRQAIRDAIDYKALLALAGSGSVQSPGMVPPGIPGAPGADQAQSRDINTAKTLVANSGVSNPTIVFEFQSDVMYYGLILSDIAQILQSNLKDVGITLNLLPEASAIVRPRWFAGKLQAYLQPLGANANDASGATHEFPGGVVSNWMGWKPGMDPASDAAVAKFNANTDPSQVAAVVLPQQVALVQYAAFIPLFISPYTLAASKSVGGLNIDSLGLIQFSKLT
jgi:peptide/nickel transport system substrate-binding protein